MKIVVINGPNINMLGIREPEIYGGKTYKDLVELIEGHCNSSGIEVECKQSNHEGDLVDYIQSAIGADGIVINPAAYTHTSIALLDALKAVGVRTVEVHISDVDAREDFRKLSYIGMACEHRIKGKGFDGYIEAIEYLRNR